VAAWPVDEAELVALQRELARGAPPPWAVPEHPLRVAGCFVCFERGGSGPGAAGDRGWAAAALMVRGRKLVATAVAEGAAAAPYRPGLLALREGPLLEAALRGLPERPEVVIANASGRDHPRGAGLALHLGAALDLPSVGITDRPLLAAGAPPADERGAIAPLMVEGREVARWLRTRAGARPVVVHAGWRTNLDTAVAVARRATRRARTPEPLRRARRAAREARARGLGRGR
jgi:deoxyribonuclease V